MLDLQGGIAGRMSFLGTTTDVAMELRRHKVVDGGSRQRMVESSMSKNWSVCENEVVTKGESKNGSKRANRVQHVNGSNGFGLINYLRILSLYIFVNPFINRVLFFHYVFLKCLFLHFMVNFHQSKKANTMICLYVI